MLTTTERGCTEPTKLTTPFVDESSNVTASNGQNVAALLALSQFVVVVSQALPFVPRHASDATLPVTLSSTCPGGVANEILCREPAGRLCANAGAELTVFVAPSIRT